MFVLSSPSGVGKTTLTKKIAEHNPNFKISISYTTRKPRPNEINGADYCFVTEQEFNTLIKEKFISTLQHAADMGIELHKAEMSLKCGFKYVQDKEIKIKKNN